MSGWVGTEVQDDQSLALSRYCDGGLAVIADIGLVRDDPSMSVDFFPGKYELAAISDFHRLLGNEAGGEMDGAGLVRVGVEEYGIVLRAEDDGAGEFGFPQEMGGDDAALGGGFIFESSGGFGACEPVDPQGDGGFRILLSRGEERGLRSVFHVQSEAWSFELLGSHESREEEEKAQAHG